MESAELSSARINLLIPGLADRRRSGQGWCVPDTLESARRWTAFVCPDCRFIFRVPREHDGRGVVCPSCRRLLKIPLADDPHPALVVPLKTSSSDLVKKRKRRSGQSARTTEDQWSHHEPGGGRRESRQMFWMLAGGGTLFVLVVAFVLKAMLGGSPSPAATHAAVDATTPAAEVIPASVHLSDADFLSAAEPLARAFLTAGKVDALLPLVRHPETTRPRILSYYPDGKIDAPGMASFNTRFDVTRQGAALSVLVRTDDMFEKQLSFFPTAEGLKIDWESWVGWSDIPWEKFLAEKPQDAAMFRVVLSPVEYYNFGFTDDRKWQSYRLISPDGEHSIYGYVERGLPLDLSLRLSPDIKQANLTLLLKFPPNKNSHNQVLITQILAEGWVLDTEP